MLFNSPEFIAFFVLVYGLYLLLPFRPQNIMLLIASYIFYGWWDTRFLFLVALSTTVDFWVGLMLENGQLTRRQKLLPALFLVISALVFLGVNLEALWAHHYTILVFRDLIRIRMISWVSIGTAGFLAILYVIYRMLERSEDPRWQLWCLMVSLVTQLGLLGVFKYFNFFVDSLVVALNNLGIEAHQLHLNIVLPVGVSFYTFQSLSYTIDIYRKQFKPTDRFFDFALFVAYFPQLQAGPIERGRQLIPQLSRPRLLNIDQSSRGMYLIVLGFFKKIAIADGVAPIVDQVFGSTGRVSWIDVIVGAVLFSVQIYCDFSGYTDIARGLSKMLGIDLVVNFNQPYFATNPQDFWRRWHVSLSTWLRDYLYVPLGGNRGGLLFVCRNLMITMLLGGLWHGAAWNFVLWGFYQGALLCSYRVWIELGFKGRLPQGMLRFPAWQRETLHLASHIVFFLFVCYGWLIFRAHSLAQIIDFTSLLVNDFGDLDYGAGIPRLSSLMGSCLLFLMEVAQYWRGGALYYRHFPTPLRGFHVAALIAITIMGMSNEPAQFIYFQF
jgi:alginate O-acetyltransferase complex protein AlgI